jgi:probable HAF family extracellular repeat protein
MRSLGALGGVGSAAFDINDATAVVGASFLAFGSGSERFHAFLWTARRGLEDLGTLGGANSEATGISQTGEVIAKARDDHR